MHLCTFSFIHGRSVGLPIPALRLGTLVPRQKYQGAASPSNRSKRLHVDSHSLHIKSFATEIRLAIQMFMTIIVIDHDSSFECLCSLELAAAVRPPLLTLYM